MKLNCNKCGKAVSNEILSGAVIRAWIECPECSSTGSRYAMKEEDREERKSELTLERYEELEDECLVLRRNLDLSRMIATNMRSLMKSLEDENKQLTKRFQEDQGLIGNLREEINRLKNMWNKEGVTSRYGRGDG